MEANKVSVKSSKHFREFLVALLKYYKTMEL